MQDLTTGSVTRHLLKTTSFMLVTMVFQTLYFLVDLYWVGRLGTAAVAAVGIAGNLNFLVLALSQMLGVGTTAVVAHAVGRKDRAAADRLFNQAQGLSIAVGVVFAVVVLAVQGRYARAQAADAATAALAVDYLRWFIPSLALQFWMVAMGSALRAVGNFRVGMIVSSSTVLLNTLLAPVLIFGWGTGHAFGVAGAAISTLVAIVVAVVWFTPYFLKTDAFLRLRPAAWRPDLAAWRRILVIGLPAGGEFAIMALYIGIVYAVTRPFGAAAQAGFGIGQRVVQALFMPVVALGFSVAPVAGQNFGARQRRRVIDTFRDASMLAAAMMALLMLVVLSVPDALVRIFTNDPAVIAVGVEYLRIVAWNFVASGLVFVNASMFQAMGNTLPSLLCSAARITIVTVPVLWMSRHPGFQLHWIWYLSVGGTLVQLAMSMLLLRREFDRRLAFPAPAEGAGSPVAA